MTHHRAALLTIASAACLDALGACLFAVTDHVDALHAAYWAVYTATTTGFGDVPVRTTAAHLVAIGVMLTAIPLWTATFSLFTSGLIGGHVRAAEDRIKRHVERHGSHPGAPGKDTP